MPNKIEMTAKQVASLDLLILQKQKGYTQFTDGVADALANVAANATVAAFAATVGAAATATPATAAVGAATAAIGAVTALTAVATRAIGSDIVKNEAAINEHLNEAAKNVRLEDLIELRKLVMVKK
jgi:hypothetical protein